MDITCSSCVDGTNSAGDPCTYCEGTGMINITKCTSMNTLHPIVYNRLVVPIAVFRSYEVLECLDPTEHAALTDGEKEGVNILLMCGRVDLNDGKVGKVRLWNWFGGESTTVAALQALIDA